MSITLRFVTDASLISWLIRRGEYGMPFPTHVEARMPDGKLFGARANGGVRGRPADYDAATWTTEQFVEIPCSQEQADRFYALLRSQDRQPYDFAVIAAIVVALVSRQRDWREPDHWICSELIAWALEGAGILKAMPTDVNHLTPRDVYLLCASLVDIGKPDIRRAA